MFVWMIFWFGSLALFLSAPILFDSRRRKAWFLRLCRCQWTSTASSDNTTLPRGSGVSSHRLFNKAQEDGIRESYLMAKLKAYTMTLIPEMILPPGDKGKVENASVANTQEPKVETQAPFVSTVPELVQEATDDADKANKNDSSNVAQISKRDDNDHLMTKNNFVESEYDLTTDGVEAFGDVDEGKICGLPCPGDCRPPSVTVIQTLADATKTTMSTPAKNDIHLNNTRVVTNGCAICLSAFTATERICWSSNVSCKHVFHEACILDWLQASGRKYLKHMRRQEQLSTEDLRQQQQQQQQVADPLRNDNENEEELSDENRAENDTTPQIFAQLPSDPIEQITTFPMLCPCCRQVFVSPTAQEDVPQSNDEESEDSEDWDLEKGLEKDEQQAEEECFASVSIANATVQPLDNNDGQQ